MVMVKGAGMTLFLLDYHQSKHGYSVPITCEEVVQGVEMQSTLNKMNKVPALVEFIIKSGM